MATLGFTVARWFVFCDGRAGIVYDEGGMPLGLDGHVLADLDAGLEAARDAGIQVDLVLLDHHWMFRGLRHTVTDPSTGVVFEARLPEGRARSLLSVAGRDGLFDGVIGPVVRQVRPSWRACGSGRRHPRVRVHERTGLRHRRMGARPEPASAAPAAVRSDRGPRRAAEPPGSRRTSRGAHDAGMRKAPQPVGVGRRCARARRAAGALVSRYASGPGQRYLRDTARRRSVSAAA